MGRLRAYLKGLRQLIQKDPLSPEAVARGWALGMFIGCTVPFGLQLMVSIPLSFLMRVSKIGATVGTLITNPVTIFFIYPAQTWVGCRLLGSPLSWTYLEETSAKLAKVSLFKPEGWQILGEISGRVLSGYFLGGFLLSLILTPPTYFFMRHLARRFRKARRNKR